MGEPVFLILSSESECGGIERVRGHVRNILNEAGKIVEFKFSTSFPYLSPVETLKMLGYYSICRRIFLMHTAFLQIPFLPKSKSVVFFHGIELQRPKYVRALQHSDSVEAFANTQETAQLARNAGFSGSIQTVFYPGLFTQGKSEAEFHSKAKQSSNPLNLLTVARLSKSDRYKGHRLILQALESVVDKCPDFHWHIVGDGDDKSTLEREMQASRLRGQITTYGFISDEELREMYRQADVFCLPSTDEGQGLVYLEAISSKLPVVALKHGAITELLPDQSSYFASENTASDLSQKLRRAITDSKLRAETAKRAFEHVQNLDIYSRFKTLILEATN